MNDRGLYPRCVSRGLVGSALPMITDSGNDITQAPGYVAIRHEIIDEARVVERFRRSSADTIEYEITVNDPGTWTRAWTLAFPWHRDDRYTMFEFACHEGNVAMRNILNTERGASAK